MSREYIAFERPTLRALESALRGAYGVQAEAASVSELTYYDTFDGLLHRAGIDLELTLGEEIPPAARAAAGRRAILPVAKVRLRTESAALLDELEKTVVRAELIAPDGLAPRLRLRGLRGYEDDLERVAALLALPEAGETLREEAILAAGGRPEGVSSKVSVELAGDDRADVAVARVIGALWEVVELNLEGAIAGTDVEFLHDLRVAVRKTRAVLKEFPGVFPASALRAWRAEFAWIQEITGPTRDLDVYVEDFDELGEMVSEADRAQLAPLLGVLGRERATARRAMVQALRGERLGTLGSVWPGLMAMLESMPAEDRPDAGRRIRTLAGRRIAKVHRRMVKAGRAIVAGGAEVPAEDYHDLRKQGKELRYLLELFGAPLFHADVVKALVRALKDLQDVLGRHQDREVQAGMVRSLADGVAAMPGGPDALIAVGSLVRALGADERAARAEFDAAFAAFAAKDQRELVSRTFGR